jgi:hypothetical protein
MTAPPPLTVIVAVREGLDEVEPVLAGLLPQASAVGAEVLVVGSVDAEAPDGVRVVPVPSENIFRMRMVGIHEAHGDVVAIGEDHAIPRPDWCDAVIRAHAEQPHAPAIAGCLVNATDDTLSGRGNFLGFAAPYQPPMPTLPPLRPPPLSALSFKRAALAEVDELLGRFETMLVPRLFAEGRIAVDDRIIVDHYQDHGALWAIANGFHGARSAYGYLRVQHQGAERLRQARWGIVNWPKRIFREARAVSRGDTPALALATLIGTAVGVGAAVGSVAGPGKAPDRVA